MSVLMWEKPKPIMSKEERAGYQADGAPPGTYMPNMSHEDQMRWKAKVVGATLGYPQVELRRNGMVVILSKKGYKYNGYDTRQTPENLAKWEENRRKYGWKHEEPHVVHVASSGAQAFTADEFLEFQQAVAEGLKALEDLDG